MSEATKGHSICHWTTVRRVEWPQAVARTSQLLPHFKSLYICETTSCGPSGHSATKLRRAVRTRRAACSRSHDAAFLHPHMPRRLHSSCANTKHQTLVTKYRDESIPPIHARAAWLNFHSVAIPSSLVSPRYLSCLHRSLLRELPSSLDVPRRAQATAGALSGSIS